MNAREDKTPSVGRLFQTARMAMVITCTALYLGGACNVSAGDLTLEEIEVIAQKGFVAHKVNDMSEAMKWLKQAADLGHTQAQSYFGYLLDKADEDEMAVEYYQLSADQGDLEAMLALAGMYRKGEGVDINEAQAFFWFKKAAEAGYPPAQNVMAYNYEFSALGVTGDYAIALDWYQRAAEAGNRASIQRLASIYQKGELGEKMDSSKAAYWQQKLDDYRQAAKSDNSH